MRAAKNNAPVDLLVVGAHPDDAELACGGTLLLAARKGYRTAIVDLTRGERGTYGSAAIRAREARAAARILGVVIRKNLGLPDAFLCPTPEARRKMAAVIRDLRPKAVLLPSEEDAHPDHAAAARIAFQGIHLATLAKAGVRGAPHRVRRLLRYMQHYTFDPNVVVDIGTVFSEKLAAIACYASQFPAHAEGEAHPRLHDLCVARRYLETRARHHGSLIRVEYGEGFGLREPRRVSDPEDLWAG